MKQFTLTSLFLFCTCLFSNVQAQCSSGEVEVTIEVLTDNWGYETYWELLPTGNNCGVGTIFSGGNSAQVACNGAGQQDASAGNGYGNNSAFMEGPWCLVSGTDYDLISIDDYGDGGAKFKVYVNGFEMAEIAADGASSRETFTASEPFLKDLATHHNLVFDHTVIGDVAIRAEFMNEGQNTITSFDFNYSVDGGATQTQTLSGVSIPYGEEVEYTHNVAWNASAIGFYNVDVWVSNINGSVGDDNAQNDHSFKDVSISNPIPNILDQYITETFTIEEIANASDQINHPRDLDFHPEFSRKELWVINKGTENSGGSTVTIYDAGDAQNQTSEYIQDGNAWHFMSLPTAIAFGENGNWGTSPGVQDANHGGGTFTGPSLWTSNTSIYGVIGNPPTAEFNGSHLDMLHGSPFSMGMAHLIDNTFFVFDSYNEEIVKYAFNGDHGPGKDDHANGQVWRYPEVVAQRDGEEVPNHMVINKATGQLYIADHKNARVLRMDVNSGTVLDPNLPLINEPLSTHASMTGVDWAPLITSGLTTPCGIDVIENTLVVGDNANGNILLYDLASTPPTLLKTIATNASSLMGIKIGPDGRIWYVDAVANTVNKINVSSPQVGISDLWLQDAVNIYPVPTKNVLNIELSLDRIDDISLSIVDVNGREIGSYNSIHAQQQSIDVSYLSSGTYFVQIQMGSTAAFKQFIKE